ncbi:MAG: hypothetical protein CMN76_04125 [Spirochaetaceae bacterium]|nr:hypothetical protein [Spirochaetaceae bacterium]|tara:strand:+ start:287237 stop:287701 length:465 start_codon:yes stop_codon:yes gene_type:complete
MEQTPPRDILTDLLLARDLQNRVDARPWPAVRVHNATASPRSLAFCTYSDCGTPREGAHDLMEMSLAAGETSEKYHVMVNPAEDFLSSGQRLVYLRIDSTIFTNEEDLPEYYSSPPVTLADRATEFDCILSGPDASDFRCSEERKETLSGDLRY